MPCHSPTPAWIKADATGLYFHGWSHRNPDLYVPCNGCLGCRLDQSRDWAVRSVHEAQLHEQAAFITLTYSEENIPPSKSLVKRDFQLFMKKYRKDYGKGLKYLMCGEYGEAKKRPHYHALIFGHDFVQTDGKCEVQKINANGDPLWRSPELASLWGLGHCLTGAVSFQSAAYVGRYVMKKQTGTAAKEHYWNRSPEGEKINPIIPEYVQPSTGGKAGRGLSYGWISKYLYEVYNEDFVVIENRKYKPPRYYDKILRELDANLYDEIKIARVERAEKNEDQNYWQKLEAKEKIQRQRFEKLVRDLE